ncbi:MAG: fluoride efflux transporter CrcB [Candidatus Bathyarchaeota archaeon]|nr:fluoride efflux transporter CrcB [Candidatus Bathyarchaeota archaeon]
MKGIEFLLLAIGAIIGAYLRYRMVESPITIGVLPVNVLIVNVLGSFILGLFSVLSIAFNLDSRYSIFMAVGFCGSFTTMSSFELETVNLVDSHRLGIAALDMAANVGLSFVAVIGGRLLGTGMMELVLK